MKVLLLSERDFALVKKKVEQEKHCASVSLMLMRAWEKQFHARWHARSLIRLRAFQASQLLRILSQ